MRKKILFARPTDRGNLFFSTVKEIMKSIDACGYRLARSTPTSRTITTTSTISSNSSNSNNNSRRVNRRCRVLVREGPVGRGAARRWPGPEACSATTAPQASRRRDYRRPWSILSPRLTPVSKNSILPPAGARTRATILYFLSRCSRQPPRDFQSAQSRPYSIFFFCSDKNKY